MTIVVLHMRMWCPWLLSPHISQLDNNELYRASGFGYGLASEIETNSSADIT